MFPDGRIERSETTSGSGDFVDGSKVNNDISGNANAAALNLNKLNNQFDGLIAAEEKALRDAEDEENTNGVIAGVVGGILLVFLLFCCICVGTKGFKKKFKCKNIDNCLCKCKCKCC